MKITTHQAFQTPSTTHYTQVRHPLYNPHGVENTEDCGPTCLAMLLSLLGLGGRLTELVPLPCLGIQGLIDRARYAMFGSSHPHKSSYLQDAQGNWRLQQWARHTLSNLSDLQRAAVLFGVSTTAVTCLSQLRARDTLAILAGDPSLPGAHGKRLGIDYEGGHFILVKGYNNAGEFEVCDPLCLRGPTLVTPAELVRFTSAGIFGSTLGLSFSRA